MQNFFWLLILLGRVKLDSKKRKKSSAACGEFKSRSLVVCWSSSALHREWWRYQRRDASSRSWPSDLAWPSSWDSRWCRQSRNLPMWAVFGRSFEFVRSSWRSNFPYFSAGQVAVVLSGDVLQLLEIEWDDFCVQSDELLGLDIIVGLVRHDGNFWSW